MTNAARVLFFKFHGWGPWPCFFCNKLVHSRYQYPHKLALAVHHRDHDHENNRKTNLKASHNSCHGRYHRSLQPSDLGGNRIGYVSEEGRQRISAANKERVLKKSTRKKISVALTGHSISDETRERIGKATQRGWIEGREAMRRGK